MAALGLRDLLGRLAAISSPPAPPSAEVDDPVGLLDHVEVVLDHEHRVAGVHEPLSTSSSFSMSAKWRPVVGSSRM